MRQRTVGLCGLGRVWLRPDCMHALSSCARKGVISLDILSYALDACPNINGVRSLTSYSRWARSARQIMGSSIGGSGTVRSRAVSSRASNAIQCYILVTIFVSCLCSILPLCSGVLLCSKVCQHNPPRPTLVRARAQSVFAALGRCGSG